ncbi:hypothetical protein MKZ01_14095 [Lysinibacillus endophyticus]|uniref:hypothetical protein n=1 Tax=Ureibacillus endophyticus TaxID=1978490 RepID=UPI003135F6D4
MIIDVFKKLETKLKNELTLLPKNISAEIKVTNGLLIGDLSDWFIGVSSDKELNNRDIGKIKKIIKELKKIDEHTNDAPIYWIDSKALQNLTKASNVNCTIKIYDSGFVPIKDLKAYNRFMNLKENSFTYDYWHYYGLLIEVPTWGSKFEEPIFLICNSYNFEHTFRNK